MNQPFMVAVAPHFAELRESITLADSARGVRAVLRAEAEFEPLSAFIRALFLKGLPRTVVDQVAKFHPEVRDVEKVEWVVAEIQRGLRREWSAAGRAK